MSVSAHELLRTRDCVFPNCDREAAFNAWPLDGLCRVHADEKTAGRLPEAIDDTERLRGMFADDAEPPEPRREPDVNTCKIEGCEATPRDRRGMYAGLCALHKEEKREARYGSARQAEPVQPPPLASANGSRAHRIAELEQLIPAARERLVELQAELIGYLDDLRELAE